MQTETSEMRKADVDNDLRAAERTAKRRRADLLEACRRAVECLEHFAAEARSRLERAAELEGARLLELPGDVLSASTWGAANATSKLSSAPQVAAEYMNALALGRGAEGRHAMNATICTRTNARREACSCGTCARDKSPDAKRRANTRDALALLALIAGCIENHPREQVDSVTWGHVADAAHMRQRLMEIAIGFALGRDGDEQDARRRIEEALCADDEHVGEALIDAM